MISFDLGEFERIARNIGGAVDQIPFALSQSLNDAAFKARDHFITQTWPQHVQVRDRNFLRNALRVEKASKGRLVAAVTTEGAPAGNRAHLGLHNKGGTKQARGRLAIPSASVKARRSGKGIPKSLRPSALSKSFRRGKAIYQVTGKGKNRKVRLMYGLASQARIKADVPFSKEFEIVMRREARETFPKRMMAAMRTRR